MKRSIKSWSKRLVKQCPELKKVYSDHQRSRSKRATLTQGTVTHVNACSAQIDPPARQNPPQSKKLKRKVRRDSYGPSGSFVASDDDDGEEEMPIRRKIERTIVKSNGAEARDTRRREFTNKRVDRILKYVKSYNGWDAGVFSLFNECVVENELQGVSSSAFSKIQI